MNVGELIDFLEERSRDRGVVLAKDNEGNGYSPLSTVKDVRYVADSAWSGELSEDGGDPVVLLGPVN